MTVAGPLLIEDLDRPYEYRTFKVGDRVRVRLSGECRTLLVDTVTGESDTHGDWENGLCGKIIEIDPPKLGTHPYSVRYDRLKRVKGDYWESGMYAAAELEPLDPEATS